MNDPYQQNVQNLPDVQVYQVEFNTIATGKVLAMSKRRIRWRFGFPNREAVDAGEVGTRCRGEEHDITFVWSVASGKRMILVNSKQIYMDTQKSSTFEYQWTDERGNVMRMTARATPPRGSFNNRQYDLFINGISFFTLPKAYEIGLRGVEPPRIPGVVSTKNLIPATREEEMSNLNKAIELSLKESREHLSSRGRLNDNNAIQRLKLTDGQPSKSEEVLIDLLSSDLPNTQTSSVPESSDALLPINIGMQQHLDPFITTVSSQHNPFHNTVSANKSQANFQFQEGYNQLEVANRNSYPNYQVPVVHNNYSAQHAAQQPVEYHHAPVSNDGHYTQQNYQKQGSNTNEQYGYSTFYQQQR